MKTKKKLPSVEKLNKEMSIHDTEFMCCFYPQVKTSYTHFVWYEWIKLVYVTHGCLQCQVGSSQFTIEAGEMFFFGYNCMHYLVNATPNTQRKEIYLNIGLVLDKLNTDIFSGTYGQIKKNMPWRRLSNDWIVLSNIRMKVGNFLFMQLSIR